MLPSRYGHKYKGVNKFWVEQGPNPENYSYGPFDTFVDAQAEAKQLMAEGGWPVAVVGVGDEVTLNTPDADDIIEQITDGVYQQCGEAGADFLDHHRVSQEQRNELTAAVTLVIADWMTRYDLWPRFCQINEVATITPEAKS